MSIFWKTVIKKQSSNRPEHLEFNLRLSPLVPIILIAISIFTTFYITPLEIAASPLWFLIHESWATPDVDEAHKVKGFRGAYWRVYSRKVKHRSKFSHSLVFGSTLRFCIGYLPIWVVGFVGILEGWISTDILYSVVIWFGVCCLSDIAHMIIDRMGPLEILFNGGLKKR